MYSYEDRLKAVKLYIKYNLSVADTIRELGYPSCNMLKQWHREFTETGELHKLHSKMPKYSLEDKERAVSYYVQHGRNMTRTIRAIGYRETMRE
ncbi:MAG: transposase [Ethanoligenens sp.]